MRDKTREEILKEVEERIKTMVKELLEVLMKEERLLHPRPSHPRRPPGGAQSSPSVGRRFPSSDPPLSETDLPGTFRGHPRPLCCRRKHPQDLRRSRRNLRGVLLAAEHLPLGRSYPGTGESLAGKAPERGVLRYQPAGAAGQGGEAAGKSGGSVLWRRRCGKVSLPGFESAGRGLGSTQAPRICGNPDGRLPC